jgi:hypothetical protein
MPSTNAPTPETARTIAAGAGLELPEDRLQIFAAALSRSVEQTSVLLSMDYGRTEPAGRFAAPPASR